MVQRYKHDKSTGQVNLTNILKKVCYAVTYFLLFVACAYVVADSITYTLYTYFCVSKCMLMHKFCNTSGPCQTILTSKMKAWHLKHSSAQT